MVNRVCLFVASVAGPLLLPAMASAQRTSDNAVTAADDAFGTSVGDEQIGIYNPFDVRGFSPVDAGNVRIEGVYFDQQSDPTDRMVSGSTVRVGISAQGYPFPAPTGIADYALRKPGAKAIAGTVLTFGPFDGWSAEVDAQLPIDGERFGVAAGLGFYRDHTNFGATPHTMSYAVVPRWRPGPDVEILGFFGRIDFAEEETQTIAFTAGDYLPPRIKRGGFTGQPWADNRGHNQNYGAIAKIDLAGFRIQAGIARSERAVDRGFSDLLIGVGADGRVADRLIIADANTFSGSTSGEVRVSRDFGAGDIRHTVHLLARGRDQRRRYGGEDIVSLGPTLYGERDDRPEPLFAFGPQIRDKVRQTTLGAGYALQWRGRGELGIGVQKTDYRKTIDAPGQIVPVSRDKPWLLSATAAIFLSPRLAIYGGYVRGLEESPVAPDNAINRSEAPPAIRTRQADAGLRWTIKPGLSAVIGLFEVVKPYYNVDAASRFRRLGEVRHRGIEVSIAGTVLPGLNIVAGSVFLDPEVSGEEVDAGLIRARPVGAILRHTIANVDYRPVGMSDWSFDLAFEETGDRIASATSDLVVPPRWVVSVGTRYRFRLARAPALVRAQIGNLFNRFGYGVGGSGSYVYNTQRRFTLTLAADF